MTSKTKSQKNTAKNTAKRTQSQVPSTGQGKSSSDASQKSLKDLLEDNLKDIYSAETQLVEALPQMAEAAYNKELKSAIKFHLEQTKKQVTRLEKVFAKFGIDTSEVEECAAMKGLIEEGNKVIEEYDESHVRDSALIIASQKVEHYEIAAYGSVCELADVLGYNNLNEFLGRSLNEEESTDRDLSEIAMMVNDMAMEEQSEDELEFEEDIK